MNIKKIAVLLGGSSEEREVSLVTGEKVAEALAKKGYQTDKIDPVDFSAFHKLVTYIKEHNYDIVFNALHGKIGEDGKIQALFELEGIPYTGSDFKSSVLAMDKIISAQLAAKDGIPIPGYIVLNKQESYSFQIKQSKMQLPVVIKPVNSGSSFGITIVKTKKELHKAMTNAFKYDNNIMIEKYIAGRELTVTILNNRALPVVEIKPKNGWYNYANKYTKGNTKYIVPADLGKTEKKLIGEYAEKIFTTLGCSVYGRVDFRYDGHKFYFLEVNTLPGMTELSLTPMAAKESGLSFSDLLKKIIELSFRRF